ncbi:GNAT family N-acetyltransferase [Pseudomonas asplenii]|uniref:Protein N-acetyltransferase, RimJ/RimL family n=1 Tax=Pseudomonas asplenii TaxID=53407 RepID=A0A1H6NKQ3_9PSED|nr:MULTISPECIES: GNAT family N-acetyltransferase [Pseudomonas]UZE30969.1 GNAT family N-acetyltransferase [Pseudomonas asplenii]SEI16144.1 Protein N-acetyltransferase, RimJ/RimL family [Pseudomonas fuscovaginae]
MEKYPTLYSERLILQPMTLADAPAVQQLFPHWEVVRYLNALVPWPYPDDGALNYLRDIALPAVERGEEWLWSIRLKTAPQQMIGSISLMNETDNNRGFWLAPQWQGQGLMSEASRVVAHYWFEVLERPLMRVPKAAANLASRRISEREGMRLIRSEERTFVSGRLPCDLWEITREEWRRNQSPDACISPE